MPPPSRTPTSHARREVWKVRAPFLAAAIVPIGVIAASATGVGHSTTPKATALSTEVTTQPITGDPEATVQRVAATFRTPDPLPPPIPPPPPAVVADGQVPATNYDAYRRAADIMAKTNPACGIPWSVIAGIGKVESHHANNGDVDPTTGELRTPIYGPTLDGTLAANEVISDTDGGRLDGDSTYDRAVGPMQFLPSTWEHYGADGNGDGQSDPQNIYDAALTTARYLCDGHQDLRSTSEQVSAILKYNNSMAYVDDVLGFARSY
ncbi:murein transglycosylase [Gordonia sp. SID5947]|nr:murein transglycosylase [Gordonia sp. SID5947]